MTAWLGRALLALCLGIALGLGTPAFVSAQDTPSSGQAADTAPDFDAFEAVASRAEAAIAEGTMSNADFTALRTELSDWRARFLAAENANASRISTIQGQIDALGPAPEDGQTELQEVADRRAELDARLSEAEAPRRRASEAYNRANGLIGEIDQLIRARDTEALFEAAPAPVNPANWPAALRSLAAVADAVRGEISSRISEDAPGLGSGLPLTILLVVLGLVLILRGRAWTIRATNAVLHRQRERARLTLGFFVSFTQLFVPILGLVVLLGAVMSTGIAGPIGLALLTDAFVVVITVFFALWLANRLFPVNPDEPTALTLAPERRPRARWLAMFIGLGVGLTRFVETFAGLDEVESAAKGVFVLPLYVLLAYMFLRLAGILDLIRGRLEEDGDGPGFHVRLLQVLSPALRLVAIVGPIVAAAGYLGAAQALMVPAALSLGVLGVLQALQIPIRDTYAAVSRRSFEDAGQALVPVLVNFVLAFAALPVFALIWGVRPAELGEIYARFNEGFALGGTRITPGTIFSVVLVFLIGLLATRLLQGALKTTVLPRTRMDAGARNAITAGIGYVGIALALLIAINAGGIDLTALTWVLSALGVGIGFGLQNVVSNFVSGIILLIERPISEGDWIEVNGQMGIVKSISVRSTRIETFDKTDVIVPNADFISGTVTNWTRGNNIGRAVLTVGVAYGTDTRRVQEILTDIAKSHPGVAAYPEPGVDFLGFGADSLDFRIRAILRDVNQILVVTTEINHQIAERFKAEGIEIPFAQRDIWLRNPEALRSASSGVSMPTGPRTASAADIDLAEGDPDGDAT
ncbi:DUF3772 domain-containing protein [Rhodobacterales bacterium HKCCE3408]|nr:DUF3772 domain-containing protein [Rhodobacterales bacterium HKCCE3408]